VRIPVDVDALGFHVEERARTVEHDDDVVHADGPASSEVATGGDMHRLADTIQRYPVACREGLHARDTGDHLVFEDRRAVAPDDVEDPYLAGVVRRLATGEAR